MNTKAHKRPVPPEVTEFFRQHGKEVGHLSWDAPGSVENRERASWGIFTRQVTAFGETKATEKLVEKFGLERASQLLAEWYGQDKSKELIQAYNLYVL